MNFALFTDVVKTAWFPAPLRVLTVDANPLPALNLYLVERSMFCDHP